MKIIILGVGKTGGTIVENLIKENHDVIVVDKNASAVNAFANKYDVKGVVGVGLDRRALLDVGIEDSDCFIACTAHDEINILACILAKKLGAKKTIARVVNPDYFGEVNDLCEYMGLDLIFNPEYTTAMEIAKLLRFPSAKNIESFADGKAFLVAILIKSGNAMINKSVKQIIAEYGEGVIFLTVERDGKPYIPHGDFVVKEGDLLHIIGSEQKLIAFTKKLKIYIPSAKSVFIIGGGKITYYLAAELLKKNISVKILEKDESRCADLSVRLPKATVILGDGTQQELLNEENFTLSDAFVATTGMDEENVITSLYAISKKINKVITKVDRPTVLSMVENLGIDTAVSPKDSTSNLIVSYFRANRNNAENTINTLYRFGEEVEVEEFSVGEDFSKKEIPLKDLKLRSNVLIGGIVRGGEFIAPTGSSVLKIGDRVIVVSIEKQLLSLEQIVK